MSIQPFPESPYMVPGTSPMVSSSARVLWSQITMGGMQKPVALQHPTIVTWDLFSKATVMALLPRSATILGTLESKGMPLLSIFNTCPGLSINLFCSIVRSSKSKYRHTTSGSEAWARTSDSGATFLSDKLGWRQRLSHQPLLTVFWIPLPCTTH